MTTTTEPTAPLTMQQILDQMSSIATRLRTTAQELRTAAINPHHAANRLAKIANEIDGGEK